MIVWSRGLGKLRLPMELADATLKVHADHLSMDGVIEPVCWNYSVKLAPTDLRDFMKLLAKRETAQFLAERGGILIPFISKLIVVMPRLVWGIIINKTVGTLHRRSGL